MTDENLGQVRLPFFQASKKAPPLRNPGHAPGQQTNFKYNTKIN